MTVRKHVTCNSNGRKDALSKRQITFSPTCAMVAMWSLPTVMISGWAQGRSGYA
ncbi:hypothetical protein BDN67DRAFT_963407 [Paxillus ammoniavirescens]|nr:hypothetical protein BDN67DRAFT_963407 [Paxillus ammoniavirescens]